MVRAFSAAEVTEKLAELTLEVGAAFSSDRFAVLRRKRTVAHMYAAAALAHCCELARVVTELHARGDELAARMVARGVFESWAVGLYLHHGGFEAAEALWGDFHHEVKTQADEASRHDEALLHRRAQVAAANERTERDNAAKRHWNAAHPDKPQKRPNELLPEPLAYSSSTTGQSECVSSKEASHESCRSRR